MAGPLEDLRQAIEDLPPNLAGEILDYVVFLRTRHGLPNAPNAEDRAWLNADLSRLGEIEPYDWGPGGEPVGKPIVWNDAAQAFMIVGGRGGTSDATS
jgi:hypothetical protein